MQKVELEVGGGESLRVEFVDISDLRKYERNNKIHMESQISDLVNLIKEFGFTNPILIDEENEIIAGHGRHEAASRIGMKQVPCIRLSHLTDAQKRAYRIADNKVQMGAAWDFDALRLEISELSAGGYDLDLLCFGGKEIDDILLSGGTSGNTDEDDVPEAPKDPVTKLGDIWQLGKHRIICGDCTDAQTVSRLLGDIKPHLMVTDPPYGIEYDASWRSRISDHDRARGKVLNDDIADWHAAWALFPGDVAYIWHGVINTHIVAESLIRSGFEIRSHIIWSKSSFAISRGHYHMQHEPCWYVVRKGATGHWNGDRKQSTIWSINKPQKSETGHSTQKPVECMRRPILNNSNIGQAIYEPFSGSGTTIIAAEETGRVCYAIEINPEYVDIAVKRWENFTGRKAELIETNK